MSYVLDINMGGDAREGMREIHEKLGSAGGLAEALGKNLGALGKGAAIDALNSLTMRFTSMEQSAYEMANSIKDTIYGIGTQLVSDAALFQNAEADLKFAFKDRWAGMFEKVKKEAADLSFTFQETLGLASSLGRMNINPFGTEGEDPNVFLARTGKMVSAFQVLQDTADAVGKNADDVVVGLRNALGGQWKSLQDRFDIPLTAIKEWKKELSGITDKQEQYNALVGKLALMFGGAGQLKTGSWDKTIAQVPDLLMQIRAAIGGDGLRAMTLGVQDLVNSLNEIAKNEKAVYALSKAFELAGWAVGKLLTVVGALAVMAADLVAAYPALPAIAMGIAVLAAGAALAAGAMLGLMATVTAATASVIAAAVAWTMIGGAVTAFGVAALGLLTTVAGPLVIALGLATAVALGFVAALAAVAVYKPPTGTVTFFERMGALFTGVVELVRNFNGEMSYMSLEVAERLKASGMYDTALQLYAVFRNLYAVWQGFSARMEDFGYEVGPSAVALFSEIQNVVMELLHALGFVDVGLSLSNGSMDEWNSTGRKMASVLIWTAELFVGLARGAVFTVAVFVRLLDIVKELMGALKDLFTGQWGNMYDRFERLFGLFTKPLMQPAGPTADERTRSMDRLGVDAVLTPAEESAKLNQYLAKLTPEQLTSMGDAEIMKGFESTLLGGKVATEGMLAAEQAARLRRMGGTKELEDVSGIPLDEMFAAGQDAASRRATLAYDERTADKSAGLSALQDTIAQGFGALSRQPIVVEIDGAAIAKALRDNRNGAEGDLS